MIFAFSRNMAHEKYAEFMSEHGIPQKITMNHHVQSCSPSKFSASLGVSFSFLDPWHELVQIPSNEALIVWSHVLSKTVIGMSWQVSVGICCGIVMMNLAFQRNSDCYGIHI